MEQTLWTSRVFNFNFPTGMFPVIISRLRGSIPRIAEIISEMSSEQLVYQPGDSWSIQQHIGHLADLEELHSGRIEDFINYKPELRAWDGVNKKTEEADHNARQITDVMNDLQLVRMDFISKLLEVDEKNHSFQSLHPRLKVPMRLVDMAYFVAEHDDHHIAKMWEIKNSF